MFRLGGSHFIFIFFSEHHNGFQVNPQNETLRVSPIVSPVMRTWQWFLARGENRLNENLNGYENLEKNESLRGY